MFRKNTNIPHLLSYERIQRVQVRTKKTHWVSISFSIYDYNCILYIILYICVKVYYIIF